MKKLNFGKVALFFISMTLLIGCNSNDDDPIVNQASIEGTWKLISDISEGTEFVEEGDCDFIIVFTENMLEVREYYQNDCSEIYPSEGPFVYEIVGKLIVFEVEDEEGIMTEIVDVTETTLILREFDDSDGYEGILTWERQ